MTVVTVSPDLSLLDLAVVVQQQEELLGPLIRIGNDGAVTFLEFDDRKDPPQFPTVLLPADRAAELAAGAPPAVRGQAFVNRRLEGLHAYRRSG